MNRLLDTFEPRFLAFIKAEMEQDLAHDINHVLRVVKTAKSLCDQEKGIVEVVVPAAYLHDCFSFGKGHPLRSQSSKHAADKAIAFIEEIGYPAQYFPMIHHAIVAHSFSAKVKTETVEAAIVQDADRLDAIGAIGIVRCVQVGSKLNRSFYSELDPFCDEREPDDLTYTLDHFYTKLLKLSDSMATRSAREEARSRTQFMYQFLEQLETEVSPLRDIE